MTMWVRTVPPVANGYFIYLLFLYNLLYKYPVGNYSFGMRLWKYGIPLTGPEETVRQTSVPILSESELKGLQWTNEEPSCLKILHIPFPPFTNANSLQYLNAHILPQYSNLCASVHVYSSFLLTYSSSGVVRAVKGEVRKKERYKVCLTVGWWT